MTHKIIRLEWFEIAMAAEIGNRRQIEAMRANKKPAYSFLDGSQTQDEWELHIQGAMGECAVAKYYRLYWNGSVNTFKLADIDGKIQVRTRRKDYYDLLVRPADSDNDIFILVTGVVGSYSQSLTIRGWCWGHEAKRKQWSKTHGNRPAAYFVPQNQLHDMGKLKELL